ncbi:hypothetical protein SPRG_07223 [Saprolegnia parasitica CBS 223.65]|uniref:MYND-type domain-containing protein n=1 Tax=Saprolegnia parasitica (strain CBS 223.65) TaxID=695850 RepID=A0A067CM95_SAPPC|nr:hypothetical protein SPRG_07223 [Saprolegnia parasitica CBS 223.65]KDO27947.1 hypothetical protein SPRG_07223 [Saprolegnia parasitica CBS 223.65]|eukprot:XP_012201399.1 hypothetical protein SPRG_07223 [Saprolegnia parasitica CBS 223.65]
MASRCSSCGSAADGLLRCSQCLRVYYCSRTCQVADWKRGHKAACRTQETGAIEYPRPFVRNFASFSDKITPGVCDELLSNGFVVVDNFLGRDWADAILSEVKWLQERMLLEPNKTQFPRADGSVAQFAKPNIYEADLHNASVRTQVPELDALFHSDDLCLALEDHTRLGLVPGTQGKTLKVQFNAGNGGCFPCHYDNPGRPNKRKLTCLLYLNPDWKDGDGGEIQFYPFLAPEPVTLAPRMDRLVIFSSDSLLHRVLPAAQPRHCLTIWLDSTVVNTPQDAQLSLTASDLTTGWDAFVRKLAKSPVQRLLSRGVYAEEYLESLTQCMGLADDGFSDMVASHEAHLVRLEANKPLHSLVMRLRAERGVFN